MDCFGFVSWLPILGMAGMSLAPKYSPQCLMPSVLQEITLSPVFPTPWLPSKGGILPSWVGPPTRIPCVAKIDTDFWVSPSKTSLFPALQPSCPSFYFLLSLVDLLSRKEQEAFLVSLENREGCVVRIERDMREACKESIVLSFPASHPKGLCYFLILTFYNYLSFNAKEAYRWGWQ